MADVPIDAELDKESAFMPDPNDEHKTFSEATAFLPESPSADQPAHAENQPADAEVMIQRALDDARLVGGTADSAEIE